MPVADEHHLFGVEARLDHLQRLGEGEADVSGDLVGVRTDLDMRGGEDVSLELAHDALHLGHGEARLCGAPGTPLVPVEALFRFVFDPVPDDQTFVGHVRLLDDFAGTGHCGLPNS